MKVIRILGCSLAIMLFGGWASSQEKADELLGEWYTQDNESKVLIEKKGGKYYGTITWLSEPTYEPGDDEAGVIKHDRHNRDKSLRSKPIIGITVLRGFVFNVKKDSWEKGKIYDPENGKDYKCSIHIVSKGKGKEEQSLKVRGYIGFSALGRTTVWNRVPEDERKTSTESLKRSADFPASSSGVCSLELTSPDGTLLHASVVTAENSVAGLLLVHGMQSHARWFEVSGTLNTLSNSGITCLAYDRRGSGRSGGKIGHADSAEQMLEDFATGLAALRELLAKSGKPDAPIHVLANCFGTRIALPYLMREPSAFQSVILTAPATHMSSKADYGTMQRLEILFSRRNRYFDTPLQDQYFVSSDPALNWIRNDELGLRRVTGSFLLSTNALTKKMYKAARTLSNPLLVILGTRDCMVNNQAIRSDFIGNYKGPSRVVEYDAEHYIDFTKYQSELAREVASWIIDESGHVGIQR